MTHPVALVQYGTLAKEAVQRLVNAGYAIVLTHDVDRVKLVSDISPDARKALVAYLVSHESDIAHGVNDFAELRTVFNNLLGYDAKPS